MPLTVLLATLASYVQTSARAEAEAKSEQTRLIVIDKLATIQMNNVLPEYGAIGIEVENSSASSLTASLITGSGWGFFTDLWIAADDYRLELTAEERALIAPELMAVFDAQRASINDLIELNDQGALDQAAIDRVREARSAADEAFTDVALASTTGSWMIHSVGIEAVRSSTIEGAVIVPNLIGVPVFSVQELERLGIRRELALDRTNLTLNSHLRDRVTATLASPTYQGWLETIDDAYAIARGEVEPQPTSAALEAGALLTRLQAEMQSITSDAVLENREKLDRVVADAQREQKILVSIALVLIVLVGASTSAVLRTITKPLRRLTSRAKAVAAGDLGESRQKMAGDDEFTRLGETIEDVADGLRQLDLQVLALAAGDLDHPSLQQAGPGAIGEFIHDRMESLQVASSVLKDEATRDHLTGLLNRRGLLEQVEANDVQRAIVYIDLDQFKLVNDNFGHNQGDVVLNEVGKRLEQSAEPGDLVARLGGDEFVLVTDRSIDELTEALESIEARVRQPIVVDGVNHEIGCSIGVAWFNDDDLLETSLHLADMDMFEVKASRRRARAKAAVHTSPATYPEK